MAKWRRNRGEVGQGLEFRNHLKECPFACTSTDAGSPMAGMWIPRRSWVPVSRASSDCLRGVGGPGIIAGAGRSSTMASEHPPRCGRKNWACWKRPRGGE